MIKPDDSVERIEIHDNMTRVETLARVDERTKSMQADLTQFRLDVNKSLTDIGQNIKDSEARNKEIFQRTEKELDDFKEEAHATFVKKEEFEPVRKIVYSILGIAGSIIIAAILGLVIHSNLQVLIK